MADYRFGYSDPAQVSTVSNGWISETTISLSAYEYPTSFAGRSPGTSSWGPWQLRTEDSGSIFIVRVGARSNGNWSVGPYNILQLTDYNGNPFPSGTYNLDDYGGRWSSFSLTDEQKLSLMGKTLYFQGIFGNYAGPSGPNTESSYGVPFGFSYTTATSATYTVTTNIVGSGTVTPSKTTNIVPGSTVSLVVSPNPGYFLSSLSASGGVSISNNSFTMPASNVTISAVFTAHDLTWSNDAGITFVQNESVVAVTKHGTATSNAGQSVVYDLIKNGSNIGRFTGNTKEVQLTSTELSSGEVIYFKLRAVSTLNNVNKTKDWPGEGNGVAFSPSSLHKTVMLRVNGSWQECVVHYRANSQWVEVEPYYRINGAWQACSKT